MPIESAFLVDSVALERLALEWRLLEARCPVHLLNLSYEYFSAWRRTFGDNVQCGVMTLREAGALLAVMPLMIAQCWRGPALSVRFDYYPNDSKFVRGNSRWRCFPVRQLSPPMSLESGNLRGGHLVDPTADGSKIRQHLAAAMRKIPGWTVGIFPIPVEEREDWQALLRDGTISGFVRSSDRRFYVQKTVVPWDVIVRGMSHNARKSVLRATRRAAETDIRSSVFDRNRDLEGGFRHLAAIAHASWKEAGREGSPVHLPYTERQRSFYEMLGARDSAMAQAIVFCLFRGDECCAAALTFRTGSRLTGGVTCYLPSIAEAYPGRLIVKTMTDWAMANGIQQIDFNATDPWVAPFTDSVQEYCQLVIFNRGPYGRLMNATAQFLESRRRIHSSGDEEGHNPQDAHSSKPMRSSPATSRLH